jgi:hypothetical protein
MSSRPSLERARVLALALVATGSLVAAGPCDLYASGGTPCIAAHSTTRALYSAHAGPLYQVKRGSDGATTTIAPLSAGGRQGRHPRLVLRQQEITARPTTPEGSAHHQR